MITKILNAIKNNKDVSAYSITEKLTSSCELFYVKKDLQTNRAANYKEWVVSVYVDKDGLRGKSSFVVDPYFDEDILNTKITNAVKNALLSLNKFYELPSPTGDSLKTNESNLKDQDFALLMTQIVPAVFRADCYENGSLNATEIFLYQYDIRIINSNGIDVSFTKYKGNIELIPSFVDGENKFEIYKMVSFSSLDTKKITAEINEAMEEGLNRSKAINLPEEAKKVKVLIPASELGSFFSYFTFKLNYSSLYNHLSNTKIGDNMQGDVKGDKITLTLKPMIDSSTDSSPVDNDGVILSDVLLVKDGVAHATHGSYQYGYWLGEKHPTGSLFNMSVEGGSKTIEEMKKEPYLECVKFSGIQMDPFTGFFGGEVRLGYYFDGEKKVPVTGFAISGNIEAIKEQVTMSKELKASGNYEGPAYIESSLFKIN